MIERPSQLGSGVIDRLNPIELVLSLAGRDVLDDLRTPAAASKIDHKFVPSLEFRVKFATAIDDFSVSQ